MKKVETIQEIADKYFDRWDPGAHRGSFAAYIIKSERAQALRLVRKRKAYFTSKTRFAKGYQKACDDILYKLKEGR